MHRAAFLGIGCRVTSIGLLDGDETRNGIRSHGILYAPYSFLAGVRDASVVRSAGGSSYTAMKIIVLRRRLPYVREHHIHGSQLPRQRVEAVLFASPTKVSPSISQASIRPE